MNQRQAAILAAIISEYIRTGEPVGSGWLVSEAEFEVSPATIRNEMGELDEAGYLEQPHTSAGRVPTEEAFRYYLEHFLEAESPSLRRLRQIEEVLQRRPFVPVEVRRGQTHGAGRLPRPFGLAQGRLGSGQVGMTEVMKELARRVSAIAEEATLVGWEDGDAYMSGLVNLLRQREFEDAELRLAIAAVFEDSEELLGQFAGLVGDDIVVVIGESNPLGEEYGSVITRLPVGSEQPLLGIVGPLRMDYRAHVGLLQQLHKMLGKKEVEVKVR